MSEYELLERRVAAVEQEVEGEKLVTRHILEQTRRNSDDLAAIRSQLARIEHRQDRTDGEVRALRADFVGLRGEFAGLRQELPGIIADTLREVLREERK